MAYEPVGLMTLTPIDPPGTPLQFTTDPNSYTRTAPKTRTRFRGLDGVQATQDWGRYAGDVVFDMKWDGNQFLAIEAVQVLEAWADDPGARYRFTDGEGNDATVEIADFKAERFGLPEFYHASLRLEAVALAARLGVAYTGS
jgi:hypothetical protein